MHASHISRSVPSSLLVLVCLAIVRRVHPDWVGVETKEAARALEVSPERVSRLVSRAAPAFEETVQLLTRPGRPPLDRHQSALARELALTRALLQLATRVLSCIPLRRRALRPLITGAWLTLRKQHSVTQARFCEVLSLSPRTLRHWLSSSPPTEATSTVSVVVEEATAQAPRRRGLRRSRFGFGVTLPGLQVAGDTTGLSAFGVPLKLMAAQDVGGRDANLFEAVIVDESESAESVSRLFTETLESSPGAQAVTDQGSPYMAKATREALDHLEVEHAPQKEGDPFGKSPLERAFLTAKSIAAPLLSLTDRAAAACPSFREPELAKGAATLVLTALLRAYQAGARATRAAMTARGGADPETLSRLAEESRERSRAQERSARLLLAHIHELYDIQRPLRRFVDGLRRYSVPVLQRAEVAFRGQVHRTDIRDRASYFAAIVRSEADRQRKERQRQERVTSDQERRSRQEKEDLARHRDRLTHPDRWLADALRALAQQWDPKSSRLQFGGRGVPRGWMRTAVTRLRELHGPETTRQIVTGILESFRTTGRACYSPELINAVSAVLWNVVEEKVSTIEPTNGARTNLAVILGVTPSTGRPPPTGGLRN